MDNYDGLHDVLLGYGIPAYKMTDMSLMQIYDRLPMDIRNDALEWGLNDTVVRDNIHEWVRSDAGKFVVDSFFEIRTP